MSEFLSRAGIDGVKYPADSYRKSVKDGDNVGWNYVSFRDDNIRVDHKWRDGVKQYSITDANIPSSVSEWGNKYDEQAGRGAKAVEFLLKQKEGYVPGAFHRDDIGDIAVVYGKTGEGYMDKGGYGLAHIIKRHGNLNWNELERLIQNGRINYDRPNELTITDRKSRTVIGLSFHGEKSPKWVVTAYGKEVESRPEFPSQPNSADAERALNATPNGNNNITTETQLSITPEQDAEYMDAVKNGDIERARRMIEEVAAKAFPVTGTVEAEWIEPVNGIEDEEKYALLVEDFKKNGWHGRPVLAWNEDGRQWRAFTGSHRILAAREAEIDVPVYEIPYETMQEGYRVLVENEDSGDELINSRDDYDRDDVFRRLVEVYGLNDFAMPRKLLNLENSLDNAVTYDDDGNVIPLSQRFNAENLDIRYSIGTRPDGREYVKVDIDQHIFDGLSPKECLHLARKVILDRFKNKAVGYYPNNAYVNKGTAEEYAYPASIKRLTDDVMEAKGRASTELDELMKAATFLDHTEDDGRHPDAKGGWDHYSVEFEFSPDNVYRGKISVKITDRGRVFHDMTQIEKVPASVSESSRILNRDLGDNISPEKHLSISSSSEYSGGADSDGAFRSGFYTSTEEYSIPRLLMPYLQEKPDAERFLLAARSALQEDEARTAKAASEFLARASIDGVKYPVGSFTGPVRDGDEVGWNYVSFRDDNIRVDHKWRDGEKVYSISQGVGSAATSLNHVAAGFKAIGKLFGLKEGMANLDLGGGRYDAATEYLADLGVENVVFDPFNRTSEANRSAAERVRNEKLDTVGRGDECCRELLKCAGMTVTQLEGKYVRSQ